MYYLSSIHHHLTFTRADIITLAVVGVWELLWKGIALWKAGRNKQLAWFVVMLLLNTAGILEICYLLLFQPKGASDK